MRDQRLGVPSTGGRHRDAGKLAEALVSQALSCGGGRLA